MKHKLTRLENLAVGSLLFGMFFGAGNLIFPVLMGQLAGQKTWPAVIAFILTAVGLPFLGIVGIGMSNSDGLFSLALRVNKPFAYGFTILLYLTIGPFFALPRLGNVSYEVGLSPVIASVYRAPLLAVFTILFYALALFFALRPSKIVTWIGRIINPLFLLFLAVLFLAAFITPMGDYKAIVASDPYIKEPFFKGFLEGYNTMDALAALAFGIIVIESVKQLGIREQKDIQKETVKAGIVTLVLMSVIYALLAFIGAMSVNVMPIAENGGLALAAISRHYFGSFGQILLAIIVTLACLKTAIGLIVACSETFLALFPNSLSYKTYAILFTILSCLIANVGLEKIISLSIPVLMLLYPMAITLILLALLTPLIHGRTAVYKCSMLLVFLASIGDLFNALPIPFRTLPVFRHVLLAYKTVLPFFDLGMGFICPLAIGLILGLVLSIRQSPV